MKCAAAPCSSCPYRTDTPPGVWHASEYEKLREFSPQDGRLPRLKVFLCHQTHRLGEETICRGWLSVERDSIAVRLALIQNLVTIEQVEQKVAVPLYSTGEAAAAAGLVGINAPTDSAKKVITRLLRKGIGR